MTTKFAPVQKNIGEMTTNSPIPEFNFGKSTKETNRGGEHVERGRLVNLQENDSKYDILNVKEIANILRVSPTTVYDMLRRGEIPQIKIGRLVRVRKCDIQSFIENSVIYRK